MFSIALKRHGQLCIGLYRLHDQAAVDSNKRYVITNPPSELRLLLSDYVSNAICSFVISKKFKFFLQFLSKLVKIKKFYISEFHYFLFI